MEIAEKTVLVTAAAMGIPGLLILAAPSVGIVGAAATIKTVMPIGAFFGGGYATVAILEKLINGIKEGIIPTVEAVPTQLERAVDILENVGNQTAETLNTINETLNTTDKILNTTDKKINTLTTCCSRNSYLLTGIITASIAANLISCGIFAVNSSASESVNATSFWNTLNNR